MKRLKVVNISPGLSGAGLISDFLLNRKDFTNPFNLEAEFRLLHDPGGIHNLYKGLYENFSAIIIRLIFLTNLKDIFLI